MPVAALCASHTPLKDYRSPGETIERDVAECFAAVRDWVSAFEPELLVVIAPDHFNGFFYNVMPAFCIGAAAEGVGDWKTRRGPLPVDARVAEQCVTALQARGLDPAISYHMVVDHGCTQIIEQLFGPRHCPPVLPVFINCAAPPLPPLPRAAAFGAALGAFLGDLDRRTLVVGSGGLSHDPPVPTLADAEPAVRERLVHGGVLSPEARAARQQRVLDDADRQSAGTSRRRPLNPEWDQRFLEQLAADDLDPILELEDDDISNDAGCGGHEVRTWISTAAAARSAGARRAQIRYYRAIPEWIAGFGVLTIDQGP